MAIERVGVVGAGQMGAGIAEVCARAGTQVLLGDIDDDAIERGRATIEASLAKAVERGKVEAPEAEATLGRIEFTTDLAAFADRQVVIEAVVEDHTIKSSVFAELDTIVSDEQAILATNTSSIPIITLATATARPQHVLGLHFFNPAPVMKLVEVVPSLMTDEAVIEASRAFITGLGKHPIIVKDRAGFVVNALLTPLMIDAVQMLESEVATADDIDKGMELGASHPMGPLALADLIGLDTVLAVAESLYDEFRDAKYAAPPLLRRLVDAGHLGRKTGRGFYSYD